MQLLINIVSGELTNTEKLRGRGRNKEILLLERKEENLKINWKTIRFKQSDWLVNNVMRDTDGSVLQSPKVILWMLTN